MSASLAGVSGCSIMRWPNQLKRRLFRVVLNSSVSVYSSMLVIILGQFLTTILNFQILTTSRFAHDDFRESS